MYPSNYLKAFLILITLNVFGFQGITQNINITTTSHLTSSDKNYLFIDTENLEAKDYIVHSFSNDKAYVVFSDSISTDSPLIVARRRDVFLDRSKVGKDLLIGAGACLTSLLFVQCVGSDWDGTPPENTFYMQVGNKYVDGGPAVLSCLVGVGGCFFLTKGILELIVPSGRGGYGNYYNTTTNNLIAQTNLLKTDEKSFNSESDMNDIEQYIRMSLY